MARYWVDKHDFWYRLWIEAGAPAQYAYSQAELDAFVEPAEFQQLAATVTAPKAQIRFAALRALRPMSALVADA